MNLPVFREFLGTTCSARVRAPKELRMYIALITVFAAWTVFLPSFIGIRSRTVALSARAPRG